MGVPGPTTPQRADRTELYWVSRPVTRHSRNLAVRPELAIVIFDSTAPVYTGQAVYNEAVGGIVPEEELWSAG